MYARVVLAYDGSEAGQRALLDCREIAQWGGAALHLFAVVAPHVDVEGSERSYFSLANDMAEKERADATLKEGMRLLAGAGRSVAGDIGYGDVVLQVAAYAEKVGADLIVVGHKHRVGWTNRWWRRSVSKSLIECAPCSVLIVITT